MRFKTFNKITEISEFIAYCCHWYDKDYSNSSYGFAATEQIVEAALLYVKDKGRKFKGDTIDREAVRDIILNINPHLVFPM